jgi:heterodisulfide reductase subunit C
MLDVTMNNFGFKLEQDTQIDYNRADRRIASIVAAQEPSLRVCLNCGTCAATCSAAQFTGFSFLKISLFLKRGLIDLAKEQLRKCMMCGKCQLACPRVINTRYIIFLMKKAITEVEGQQ